jgi:class 3 adenylate cyclase/tetratricopeptide (TPR) repeat protein
MSLNLDDVLSRANDLAKAGDVFASVDLLRRHVKKTSPFLALKTYGLALAKTGSIEAARKMLGAALNKQSDADTLGIMARTYKDEWRINGSAKSLETARLFYESGYQQAKIDNNAETLHYNGINLATCLHLLERKEQAASQAASTKADVLQFLKADSSSVWAWASLAEANLILGSIEAAIDAYKKATSLARKDWHKISSIKRQAELLLADSPQKASLVTQCFPLPVVATYSGHMVDRIGAKQRLPSEREGDLRALIRRSIELHHVDIAFGSAANGSDLIFCEELLSLGRELHVVLPFGRELFVKSSVVRDESEQGWQARFDAVLSMANSVRILDPKETIPNESCFEYASMIAEGLAKLRANSLCTKLICIGAFNNQSGLGGGGTSSSVERWRKNGSEAHIIDISSWSDPASAAQLLPTTAAPSTSGRSRVVSMLFADLTGFSEFNNEQTRTYYRTVYSAMADVIQAEGNSVLTVNTWGDAFFVVTSSPSSAAYLAQRIRHSLQSMNWRKKGLTHQINARFSLHLGPAVEVDDPILKRKNYFGDHVCRAARIEPIVPFGEIYCSEEFAAVAAVSGISTSRMEYLGELTLAKGYGSSVIYHLK